MTELYLRLLDRLLTPLLMLLAVWLLFRGHNAPGGGFIAGLVVAAAFELQILSRGDRVVRAAIGRYLKPLTGLGLGLALLSAGYGAIQGTFFQGIWGHLVLGPIDIELSTPLFFDIGVFLVVLSIVTSYLLGLSNSDE